MSQPPQGPPPHGPGGPPSGDQPTQGGGWGHQPGPFQPGGPPQPGEGWGQPAGQPGPPPGGGGWGAPPPASYGDQPTQVGGFGVPGQPPYGGGPGGPGGPGWGVPGGPGAPGRGGGKKKNLVITAIAAVVLLVVVAVVLAVTLGGNDDGGATASDRSSSSSSATPSTSASSSSSATSSPSGGLSPAPTGGADAAAFVSQLPADFTDCAEDELAGDGDVAAAACGVATSQPGPQEAKFYRYPDVGTLDAVFQNDVSEEGLTEFPADESTDCSTQAGWGEWQYTDGTQGGSVACQITTDGHVLVAWTDEEFLTEGVVRAPGTSQAEVSALYDWWTQHSDYQG